MATIAPSSSWDGTTSWSGRTPPVDPARTAFKPIAHFAIPADQDVTGDMTVPVVAFCKGGIEKVTFWCEGNTVDASLEAITEYDGTPFEGYQVTLDTASFPAFDGPFEVFATVIPLDGTAQSRVISLLLYCDIGDSLEKIQKYVDGTNGSDTTGDGSTGNPYATIKAARDDLQSGTDQCSGASILVRDGNYKYTDTCTWDIANERWMTIKPDTGHNPVITESGTGTSGLRADRVKIEGMFIDTSVSGDTQAIRGSDSHMLWLDKVDYTGPGQFVDASTVYGGFDSGYFTDYTGRQSRDGANGFLLARNVRLENIGSDAFSLTDAVIGASTTEHNEQSSDFHPDVWQWFDRDPENKLLYNVITGSDTSSQGVFMAGLSGDPKDIAVVNCVMQSSGFFINQFVDITMSHLVLLGNTFDNTFGFFDDGAVGYLYENLSIEGNTFSNLDRTASSSAHGSNNNFYGSNFYGDPTDEQGSGNATGTPDYDDAQFTPTEGGNLQMGRSAFTLLDGNGLPRSQTNSYYGAIEASAVMATGDIISVTIPDKAATTLTTDGWFADVEIQGFKAGGTYDFGLGAGNDPTNAKFVMTVVSEGFDSAGNLGTVTRTVYGTRQVMRPYNQHDESWETEAGGNVTLRIALSEYVYDDDRAGGVGTSQTDPTLTVAAGWYTDNGTGGTTLGNNATTDFPVVNNSTLDYPEIRCRWRTPSGYRLDGIARPAVEVRSPYGQGKAAPAVRFTLADSSAGSVVDVVTDPELLVSEFTPSLPQIEVYRASLDTATLADDNAATVRVEAFPFVGDTPFDSDNYTFPDRLATQPCHIRGDQTFAYVATDGDDGTGVVSTDPAVASASPYADIWAARNAIGGAIGSLNNAVIRFKDGSHTWGRSSFAATYTSPTAFVLCESDPDNASLATFGEVHSTAGNLLCEWVNLRDMKVEPSFMSNFFRTVGSQDYYQFNRVSFLHSGLGSRMVDSGVEYCRVYDCSLSNFMVTSGIDDFVHTAFDTHRTTFAGNNNDYSGLDIDVNGTTDFTLFTTATATTLFLSSSRIPQRNSPLITQGAVVEDMCLTNLIFIRSLDANQSGVEMADIQVDNCFWENISFYGARMNPQNTMNGNKIWTMFHANGVACSYTPPKNDVFAQDPQYTGAWNITYGVGWNSTFNGKDDIFPFQFPGLYYFGYQGQPSKNPKVIDDNSVYGDADDTAFGDYEPTPDSELVGLLGAGQATCAFDMYGNAVPNDGSGAAGAVQIPSAPVDPITYTYQWWTSPSSDGSSPMQVGSGETYEIQPTDVGKWIAVREVAERDGETAAALSTWEGPITSDQTFQTAWAFKATRIIGLGN